MHRSLEQRLRARLVETEDGCLIWTGHLRDNGYGVIRDRYASHPVHRVAWELARGRIPKGKVVRHRCGRRACANVEHLFLASKADVAREVPFLKANIEKTHWFWQLRRAERRRLIAAHPRDGIVTVEEEKNLSDDQLVALIMERTGKDEGAAAELLGIIRGGPPDGTIW